MMWTSDPVIVATASVNHPNTQPVPSDKNGNYGKDDSDQSVIAVLMSPRHFKCESQTRKGEFQTVIQPPNGQGRCRLLIG